MPVLLKSRNKNSPEIAFTYGEALWGVNKPQK